RTRNDLDTDDRAGLGRRRGACVRGGLDAGDIAAEERRDVTAADFFPAGERDVGRFERGVRRFEQGAKALGFDHADCGLSHNLVGGWKLMVDHFFGAAAPSPRKPLLRSSCGRAMTWAATSSPILPAALAPAST